MLSQITALVADDVAEMRLLLRSTLREFNCEVVGELSDGTQVLASIQRTQPDMLLLDLDMPRMTGLEVLAELGALQHPPYTVIITADTSAESRDRALAQGADAYIAKPYTAQKIGEVIQDYCAKRDAALMCSALIADDEALMRDLLKKLLAKQHCQVSNMFENGAEVISHLEQNPAPDLMFLDIDMPVLDGLGALRKIRENQLNVFCVMVSAHSTFENVKNAMNQGADGFIVKPYSEDKLRQILSKFHARKKQNMATKD